MSCAAWEVERDAAPAACAAGSRIPNSRFGGKRRHGQRPVARDRERDSPKHRPKLRSRTRPSRKRLEIRVRDRASLPANCPPAPHRWNASESPLHIAPRLRAIAQGAPAHASGVIAVAALAGKNCALTARQLRGPRAGCLRRRARTHCPGGRALVAQIVFRASPPYTICRAPTGRR